jgi:hypothetical protein
MIVRTRNRFNFQQEAESSEFEWHKGRLDGLMYND